MKRLGLTAVIMVAMAAGCDRSEPAASSSGPHNTSSVTVPETLILASAPEGAQDLAAVKESAKPGDQVTIRGVIGGREEPLAENRAVFMLIDPSVTTCDRMPGDSCKTPWDACCEDPDLIKQKSATVQVVDAEGQPLKKGLSGVGGIAPNKPIIVKGVVREGSDAQNLVVDATGIHVQG